jgi:hypothetical protein
VYGSRFSRPLNNGPTALVSWDIFCAQLFLHAQALRTSYSGINTAAAGKDGKDCKRSTFGVPLHSNLHKTSIDEANKPSLFSVHCHRSMLHRAVSRAAQRLSSCSSALENPLHCSSSAPASSVCQHQTRSIISIPVNGNKVTISCGTETCGGLQEV